MTYDLFSQPDFTRERFTHDCENKPANLEIYNKNRSRLSTNCRIMLQAMLEGQRLTGLKCMQGIKTSDRTAPKIICEYRKRIQEINTELKLHGLPVLSEQILEGGFKEWWIENSLINIYKEKLL